MMASVSPESCRLRLKCGPTIAAEAGDARSSLMNRSLSMNVMSPGPASATVRRRANGQASVSYQAAANERRQLFDCRNHRLVLSSLKGEGLTLNWQRRDQTKAASCPSDLLRIQTEFEEAIRASHANPCRQTGQGESSIV